MTLRRVYLASFFLSGAAGLVYQIAWVKVFSLVLGNTVYAVSMVVAGFLTGLAIGSHYWGKWIDKNNNPLKTYVLLEVGIAVFAVAITFLVTILDDTIVSAMPQDSISSTRWHIIRYVAMFLILLPPTTLMGGTLPVMSKLYVTKFDKVGEGIGSLYAANTYGAVLGSFLTGYVLIYFWGVWGAILTACIINLAVAFIIKVAPKPAEPDENQAEKVKSKPHGKKKKGGRKEGDDTEGFKFTPPITLAMAFFLAAMSGYVALAYEILWTRAFVISFKSTVYLFSNLLTVFLIGMALGSHVFSKWIDKIGDPVRLFGLAQVAIGTWGLLSVFYFWNINDIAMTFWKMAGEMDLTKDVFITLILMLVPLALPTFLMGLSYPLICRITTDSLSSLGKFAGLTYAIGTAGGILGALTAGFFLLPLFGLQNGIYIVSFLALITGYVALSVSKTGKKVGWVFPASALVAIVAVISTQIMAVDIGLGSSYAKGVDTIFSKEGAMGTVRVTKRGENGPLTLEVNNYQLATSGDVAVRFGHVPLLIKPDAKDVLLISLGSGITAGSISSHPVERIDCVEIVPELLDVQHLFKTDNHNVIADKRFNVTFWDGSHYVRMTKRKYDLVIADLFQPDSAGVGSLYSLEYFLDIKKALKQGGAMAQWLPLYQLSTENLKVIMKTFATAFEHVQVWSGDVNSEFSTLMLLGSKEPVSIRPDKLMASLGREGVSEDMVEHGDPLSFLSFYVMDRKGLLRFAEGALINTDYKPVIEYTAPRNIWNRRESAIKNFQEIKNNRQIFDPQTMAGKKDPQLEKAIKRYFEGRGYIMQGRIDHAMRNYPSELENYKKAAKLVPTDPILGISVFDLGYIYYHRGDFKTASEIFKWVKRIDVNILEAHFYLAKSYQSLNMKEESLAAFEELAKLKPEIARGLISQ